MSLFDVHVRHIVSGTRNVFYVTYVTSEEDQTVVNLFFRVIFKTGNRFENGSALSILGMKPTSHFRCNVEQRGSG